VDEALFWDLVEPLLAEAMAHAGGPARPHGGSSATDAT
jgi:hypothetical protein